MQAINSRFNEGSFTPSCFTNKLVNVWNMSPIEGRYSCTQCECYCVTSHETSNALLKIQLYNTHGHIVARYSIPSGGDEFVAQYPYGWRHWRSVPFPGGDTNAQYLFWWRHFCSVPILVEAALDNTQYGGDIVARYFGRHLWLSTPSRDDLLVVQYPFWLRHWSSIPVLPKTVLLNTFSGINIVAQYPFWWRRHCCSVPILVETMLLKTHSGGDIFVAQNPFWWRQCCSIPILVETYLLPNASSSGDVLVA